MIFLILAVIRQFSSLLLEVLQSVSSVISTSDQNKQMKKKNRQNGNVKMFVICSRFSCKRKAINSYFCMNVNTCLVSFRT